MKTLLYILIFNFSAICFAQDPQLFENEWYLQKLTLNGEDYFPPQNSEIENILLRFLENPPPIYITTEACSAIATSIFVIDSEYFETPGFAIINGNCTLPETIAFEGYYFTDFFHWQGPHTFGYIIEPGMNNTKVLTLTNQENGMAIYGNQPLATPDISISQFVIHPNPAKSEVHLSSTNASGNLNIKIFNIQGKLLNTQNLEFEKQVSIAISNFANGIYFLNIEDANGNVATKKFIKE